MLRMMAHENDEEFRSDAVVTIETIAAVIDAYGRGDIELEKPDPKFGMKQTFDLPGGKSYSLATVARFLGWIKPSDGQADNKCRHAFDNYRERGSTQEALQSIPTGKRSHDDFFDRPQHAVVL